MAVASGIANAKRLIERIRKGEVRIRTDCVKLLFYLVLGSISQHVHHRTAV